MQTKATQSRRAARVRAVARRWCEVVLTAALSWFGFLLLLWWQRDSLDGVVAVPAWVWLGVAAVGFLVGIRRGFTRFTAFVGARYALSYPPLWIGVALGGAAALLVAAAAQVSIGLGVAANPELAGWLRNAARVLLVLVLGTVAAGLLLAVIRAASQRVRRARRPVKSENPAPPSGPASADKLREWLWTDDPVISEDGDLFDHTRIARRIAERLAQQSPPSQAIIGPLGSGKTTVMHLVEAQLREGADGDIELVCVELWPYETPRAAVQAVIRSLVEALGRRVNVLGLTGLPAHYTEVIASAGGLASALARFRHPLATPFGSLDVIDRMATAIGVRYVLWVEDLERFAVGDPSAPQPESHNEAERLAPIRALLHGLDRLGAVTVVTATTSLYQRFDLEKIARYVERLPAVAAADVKRVVRMLRASWQSCHVIDPARANARDEAGWGADENELLRAIVSDHIVSLSDACIALSATPRILKQALRRADEVWAKLPGEIDLDAAVAMSFVREAAPAGFAIIEQHIDRIRNRSAWSRSEQGPDPMAVLRAALGEVGLPPRSIDAAMVIVEKTVKTTTFPQAFASSSPTDYWHRFLTIPDLLPHERDQETLRAIDSGNDERLLDFLCDSQRSGSVEAFAERLDADRLVRLLVPLVQRVVGQAPQDWEEGHQPPGLIPLWRTFLQRKRDGTLPESLLLDEVLRAYEIAVEGNLTLASELEHWLVIGEKEVPQLLTDEMIATARTRLRELLKQ